MNPIFFVMLFDPWLMWKVLYGPLPEAKKVET